MRNKKKLRLDTLHLEDVIKSTTSTSLALLLAAQGDRDAITYFEEKRSILNKMKSVESMEPEKQDTYREQLRQLGSTGDLVCKITMHTDRTKPIPNPLNKQWSLVYFQLKYWAAKERLERLFNREQEAIVQHPELWDLDYPSDWVTNPYIKPLVKITPRPIIFMQEVGPDYKPLDEPYEQVMGHDWFHNTSQWISRYYPKPDTYGDYNNDKFNSEDEYFRIKFGKIGKMWIAIADQLGYLLSQWDPENYGELNKKAVTEI